LIRTFNTQLDTVNADRFKIDYAKPDGTREAVTILHTALASVERWMLIAATRGRTSPGPSAPVWLLPVQVRFLPMAEENVPRALQLARTSGVADVRADVDDRQRSLGWRIRAAAKEQIPFTVVVGRDELTSDRLTIRTRSGILERLSVSQLREHVQTTHTGMPSRRLGYELVSRRCTFA
jgi:threonyl-tRNA synthetase